MPHVPAFPPNPRDWEPGRPFREPPLPRFMWNPWLESKARESITEESGKWATSRAEAMVPRSAGPQAVRLAAKHMWETYSQRIGATVAPRRGRRTRQTSRAVERPEDILEVPERPATRFPAVRVQPPTKLTAAQRSRLVSDVKDYMAQMEGTIRGRRPPPTLDVQEWAEGHFKTILSEEDATAIIQDALQGAQRQ